MINPEKIGMLIGPGGKNIRKIQEETKSVIEVEDSGLVKVVCEDMALLKEAVRRVKLDRQHDSRSSEPRLERDRRGEDRRDDVGVGRADAGEGHGFRARP